MSDTRNLRRIFRQFPEPSVPLTLTEKTTRGLLGIVLSPLYWLLAHRYHTPGLWLHQKSVRLMLQLLPKAGTSISNGWLYFLLFMPMDSTRYFEFDFAWRALAQIHIQSYLDVSSPRLFPLLLLNERPELRADLLNPDQSDLAVTANFISAANLTERSGLHNCLIQTSPFLPETFDVITSISVVEHIPEDNHAIMKMWKLLRPGGKLILSVPCAAEAEEQYININPYQLLSLNPNGFVFLQYLYDKRLLQEKIFSVTGPPNRFAIYGEKHAGFLRRNLDSKASPRYPFWREPYIMGKEFCYFDSITDLPGEAVIAMEFIKR